MNFDLHNSAASPEAQFDSYLVSLESFAATHTPEQQNRNWIDNLSVQDKSIISTTVKNVTNFINDNNLYAKGTPIPTSLFEESVGCESFNGNVNLSTIGVDKIYSMCQASGIHQQDMRAACEAIGNLILKGSGQSSGAYRARHFNSVRDSVAGQSMRLADLRDVLPATLHGEFLDRATIAQEAFGAETDRVLPDIRVSMAVTLLRFHRGIIDRIMQRRTSPSTVIKYVIPYAEVYDLMRSMDPSSQVRNGKVTRIPFIDLYGDPKVVSNTLRPIVVKKERDNSNVVVRDNVLMPNRKGNLMDLSRVPGEIGNNHTDYTDLIADGVILDRVYVTLVSAGVTEEFEIITRSFSKAKLHMQANTLDSADRGTMFTQFFKFSKNRKTVSGADSQILANLTDADCLEVEVRVTAEVNLKFHDFVATALTYVRPYSSTNAAPAKAVADLLPNLKVDVTGYTLDAKYSEENLRKSNVAVRSHYRTFDWEIPVGRNYIVDYALDDVLPEYLMANVTEAISLGQDHRAIDMIVKTLMDVYDRGHDENSDTNFRENIYKIGFDFVAGQQVRPVVYLSSIDLDEVDTIRSSDILGDIRQFVELQLINLFSLLHQNSYYKTQLNAGEKPVYKCVTSSIIMENLLNVPHIHNHLMDSKYGETADGDTVEYRRVLPSGVILECVTTTFNYMRDKMVIIPFRPNDPESVLNFCHNWDYGTYLAHYNPQIANGVNKRVFANAREMPLATNGIGLYIEVKNISKMINMYQLINDTSTSGDDLPDLGSRLPDTTGLKGPGNDYWHVKP